jgi:deoxycytidine triphosphate deaminase
MSFFTGIELRKAISEKTILIDSLDRKYPFELDVQVTEDAIDLRIAPIALHYKSNVRKIDYYNDDLPELFETIEIPRSGYELRPGKVLFTQTIEAITLPDNLVGFVFTRSHFARLGLACTCMAPKFAAGISWAFPLQIINCNSIPIIIYPYTFIAQLLLSTMQGEPIGYQGKLQHSYTPMPPIISDRERTMIGNLRAEAKTRTFHILKKEIEAHKGEIQKKTDQVQIFNTIDNNSLLTIRITRVVLGISSAIGAGIIGNFLSSDNWSQWKVVSLVLIGVLSLLSLIGSALLSSELVQALKDNVYRNNGQ